MQLTNSLQIPCQPVASPGITGGGFGGFFTPKNMTYSEKLRDPRWQKKRLEIMNRDAFQCCDCRSKTETLNVHHAFYRKGADPWDYDNEWLITLCEPCHLVAEARKTELLQSCSIP